MGLTGCITREGWRGPSPARGRIGTDGDREERTVATKRVDALVIFGATGDLAKIETFPALVRLVKVAWHDPAGQPG
jgi:Glucose-6-phosphate dehydrogenase, NAD binding domain